jgi:asparagine synthase (glutamine-hydrolysing)
MDARRFLRITSPLRAMPAEDDPFSREMRERLSPEADPEENLKTPNGFARWDPFAQMQYFDIKYRLQDSIELHLDRGAMAYSLEARVPFLDHELVEFCARIPPRIKMKWLREKYILRRAMERILPREITRLRKRPLAVPLVEWLRGELPDFAAELLSERRVREAGYFNPAYVTRVRRQHAAGIPNKGSILAAILGVQV